MQMLWNKVNSMRTYYIFTLFFIFTFIFNAHSFILIEQLLKSHSIFNIKFLFKNMMKEVEYNIQ